MVRCVRCLLDKSMKVVNLLVNVYGVAMIVYSLWLLKTWDIRASELPNHLTLPQPWFGYSSLGVGIVVCLSTLFGHIVVNSNNATILICIYILVVCALVLLHIALIVIVFFKINWVLLLSMYIDEHTIEFKNFMIFNVSICRLIVFIALVPQTYEIALAMILWVKGTSHTHTSYLNIHDFGQSFLVDPTLH